MSFTATNQLLKMKAYRGILKPVCIERMTATTAAADINGTAVVLTEPFAAFVLFQWQQANLLPP